MLAGAVAGQVPLPADRHNRTASVAFVKWRGGGLARLCDYQRFSETQKCGIRILLDSNSIQLFSWLARDRLKGTMLDRVIVDKAH